MILTLPFLGEKKYLQGTSLLDELLPQINTLDTFALEKIFCRDGTTCCSVVFEDIPSATLYFAWTRLEQEAL